MGDVRVYMKQPDGCNDGSGRVWVLKKALYGLKDAPRKFYIHFQTTLTRAGLRQLNGDPCLNILRHGQKYAILWHHVDDAVIAGNCPRLEKHVLDHIKATYKISDKGEVGWLLGMEVTRDRARRLLWISQEQYVKDVLSRFNMSFCKAHATPALDSVQLTAKSSPQTEQEKG